MDFDRVYGELFDDLCEGKNSQYRITEDHEKVRKSLRKECHDVGCEVIIVLISTAMLFG